MSSDNPTDITSLLYGGWSDCRKRLSIFSNCTGCISDDEDFRMFWNGKVRLNHGPSLAIKRNIKCL